MVVKQLMSTISEKLSIIANKLLEAYNNGKKSQYDSFWDSYQNNGKETLYRYAFAGNGWKTENFKPKYSIKPTNATNMFFVSNINVSLIDLCNELGITMDFSKCTNFQGAFQSSKITEIGILDMSLNTAASTTIFHSATYLEKIQEIILSTKTAGINWQASASSTMFHNCSKLKYIRFSGEGKINTNITFQFSPLLEKDSIVSIINALDPTITGKIATFSKVSVDKAFESSVNANDGSVSNEWNTLKSSKSNWSFSLI